VRGPANFGLQEDFLKYGLQAFTFKKLNIGVGITHKKELQRLEVEAL
jgi:hypothetical protein